MALLALSGAVAGCSEPSSSGTFTAKLETSDGSYPLPLVLTDETGLVTGMEAAAPDPTLDYSDLVARSDPANANAFIVSWLGGACDKNASLSFKTSEGVYELHVTTHGNIGFPGGCTANGIFRDIRILTSKPLPIDSIVAAGQT